MGYSLKRLFLSVVLLWLSGISAQDEDVFFRGVLLDAQTDEPVVFATVRLQGWALGVISNNDGSFQIPRELQLKGDTLVISSMGYETKQVNFWALKENVINTIFMNPSAIELSETVVTADKKRRRSDKVRGRLSAKQIIRYAIERIPDNYDKNPFELVGYYRDYQLREEKYTNLNEALIRVFDKGFDVEDHRSLQFGLYNYKTNLDFEVDSFAAKPYDYQRKDKYIPDAVFAKSKVPNELVQLFIHDAIRNNNERTYSYVYTLVKDFINQHEFVTYFLTNYGDKQVYKVRFTKSLTPYQVNGAIYIDTDTYAIRKLEYTVYRQKSDKNSPAGYSEAEMDLLYEILVEYEYQRGYMFLNYISFHNQFKLIRPPEFFIKEVILDPNTYQLIIVLNKPAVNWLGMKVSDFKVYYEGYRLRAKKVARVGDLGDTYALSFPKKGNRKGKPWDILFSKMEDLDKASLEIIVNRMLDAEGDLVGQRKTEYLDQFREFFTQKIISGASNIVDTTSFVDKKISLGDPLQPKIPVKMDEEFWMNTPLKDKKKEER
jgi:hypothetical protein